MATKTKAEPKPKAPNKTEKLAAYTAGCTACSEGAIRAVNPHSQELQPVLFAEWDRGWDETNNTNEAAAEVAEESAPKTTTKTNGHKFDDPDVVAAEDDLAGLMKAFDNLGVSIVEEQWRAFSPEDMHISAKWANDRRIGVLRPVPIILQKFASKALLDEIAPYRADQESVRRTLMSCKFGKPSPTKPDGDDCEEKIKMVFQVPLDDVSPSRAEEIWGWTRIELEFGLRTVNQWDQGNLPGMVQIVHCVTEVKRYVRKRTEWEFACFVPKDELSLTDAFDVFWKSGGSCRIMPLGPAADESKRDESENPEASSDDEDEPDDVRRPTLFDSKNEVDLNGVYKNADEYVIPFKTNGASGTLAVAKDGDRYHIASSVLLDLYSDAQPEEFGDELPTDEDDGYASLQLAIESEVGWLIDQLNETQADNPTSQLIVTGAFDELRDYLKFISGGGQPQMVPQ